jgi:hypothetical protein
MKMRRPDGDITLMDGTGFFVEEAPYQRHLKTAVELKQVRLKSTITSFQLFTLTITSKKPTCVNHKAANEARSGRNNLDVTGVGACACGRHGCFVPHTMVDFQKGERYDIPYLQFF